MNVAQKYRVNSPKVVHETIDGEVVVVNLDKGDYYSFLATGAEIWESLIQGTPSNLVVAEILNRYEGEPGQIENSIQEFLDKLQQEELIVPASSDSLTSESSSSPAAENASPPQKQPFEIPTLQKYTDMEELLALDPIHEVDEMGWPNVKQ
ncbi:PqqD family protein [Phormidium sp. CCY1219]|uniref:PqqD family protein n=1 Tax=Phormidium sp. CCY1219 TaxID=2886104 RepID=UPI002D1F9A07|nr:PqqD family protein [Phormidium sp. CCY1219]MEB3829136.1 PqqD family protein [Phormidium sp. CCY1219]